MANNHNGTIVDTGNLIMIKPKYQRMKPWNWIGLPLIGAGLLLNDLGYYMYKLGDKIAWFKRKQIGYIDK